MDEEKPLRTQWMLAVCLVDLSPDLCGAIRDFYAALPPALQEQYLYLLARAQAESAQLADATAAMNMLRRPVHQLSNDLTMALGTLDLLDAVPDDAWATAGREELRGAAQHLERARDTVFQVQALLHTQ